MPSLNFICTSEVLTSELAVTETTTPQSSLSNAVTESALKFMEWSSSHQSKSIHTLYQPYCSPLTLNSNEPVNTATLCIYKRKKKKNSYDISGRIPWQRKAKTFTGKKQKARKKTKTK